MDALPLCVVFFSAVCILPSVVSLECYACSDYPVTPGAKCNNSDNLPKVTCPLYANRCYSMKFVMKILPSMTITTRNCSNSMVCDPQSKLNTLCNLFNSSRFFDSCELKCCEGNLCDPDNPGTTVTSTPTSAGRGLAATVVVILLALSLMTYAGNN